MASFNKVILIGNMTADPELKQTTSGTSVTTFNLAVNRKHAKDAPEVCDFITCVAWRQTAEFISCYFKKGNPILVCGQIQTRTWTDNQGQKRYATEVCVDEASFIASANAPTTASSVLPSSDGAQLGFGSVQPQFEELEDGGKLPF
jgi:single-strand DNA-binding protein